MNSSSNDDDEVPLPSIEEEVAENQYDWSDPEKNDYDSDDSFMAPEGSPTQYAVEEDEEVDILSPRTLAQMERQGRPRRNRRRPNRYSPPIDGEADRYTYECVGADDDGASETEAVTVLELEEEDDDSVYNAERGSSSSSEGETTEEEADPTSDSSPRGVKRNHCE